MGWSEDRVHDWLARHLRPRGLAARALSDAAELVRPIGRAVVCIDQTVEGVHYARGTAPALVGSKAAARPLSDLAASAARPRALVLALALDPRVDERWIRALVLAVQRAGRRAGAELVGGDLCARAGPAAITVSALGEAPRGRLPIGRDRVRAGDYLVVTGPVGGSALGRHLRIEPRLAAGLWLAGLGARAIMDTTDGLGRDLWRLARASRVRIDVERVPIHPDARRLARRSGRSALAHALEDGEDHELVAALSPPALGRALAERAGAAPELEVIGRARAGAGLWVPRAEGVLERVRWDARKGWHHGQ